jgi:uncharacterized protein (DUF1330 family)
MAVYFIATYDITDPKGYEPYVPAVIPLLQKHGAEIVVADREASALEGTARGVTVVLRFADEAAARGFYDDPAYAAVKKIRLDSTGNCMAILAKQFVPAAV